MQSYLSTLLSDLEVVPESTDHVMFISDNARLTAEQTQTAKARFAYNEADSAFKQQQKNRWSSWHANTPPKTKTGRPQNRRTHSDSLLNRPMRARSPDVRRSSSNGGTMKRPRATVSRSDGDLPLAYDHHLVVNATWEQTMMRKNEINERSMLKSVDSVQILRDVRLDKKHHKPKSSLLQYTSRTSSTNKNATLSSRRRKKSSSRDRTASTKALCEALGPMAPSSKPR